MFIRFNVYHDYHLSLVCLHALFFDENKRQLNSENLYWDHPVGTKAICTKSNGNPCNRHLSVIYFLPISAILCVIFIFEQAVVSICVLHFRCEVVKQQNCLSIDQSWVRAHTVNLFFSPRRKTQNSKMTEAALKTLKVSSSPAVNMFYFPNLTFTLWNLCQYAQGLQADGGWWQNLIQSVSCYCLKWRFLCMLPDK